MGKTRSALRITALALAGAMAVAGAGTAQGAGTSRPIKYVALGDSVAAGIGAGRAFDTCFLGDLDQVTGY